VPTGHPARFVAMVAQPFAFDGAFPQRILWPLLAHLAGWFGIGPLGFSRVCSAALLIVVCWFCRQHGARWLDAVLITAAVAASGATLVYKPQACLSDPLNLLLLVLTVHFAVRPRVFWALVLLAAFSHEMVFFFAPWLLWLRHSVGGRLTRDGACLFATLAAYGAWRWLVKAMLPANAPAVAYDAVYYVFSNFWVPFGMPAMWMLWAFVVVAEFGPLLALVPAAPRAAAGIGGRSGAWLYAACVLALMLLAYDVFRFASFVFLPMVLGGLQLVGTARGRVVVVLLVGAAAVSYAWQHPIPSEQGGRTFTVITGHVQELLGQPGYIVNGRFTAATGWQFTIDLLARTWRPFVAAAVALGACLLVGRRLARDTVGGRSTADG
jgi:hypothetical protein